MTRRIRPIGEQFQPPQMRELGRTPLDPRVIVISAADPLNLPASSRQAQAPVPSPSDPSRRR